MLTKIKFFFMAGLAIAATFFYALLQTEKRKRIQDKLKAEKKAREIEKLGYEAGMDGIKKEQKIREDDTDNKPGFFS